MHAYTHICICTNGFRLHWSRVIFRKCFERYYFIWISHAFCIFGSLFPPFSSNKHGSYYIITPHTFVLHIRSLLFLLFWLLLLLHATQKIVVYEWVRDSALKNGICLCRLHYSVFIYMKKGSNAWTNGYEFYITSPIRMFCCVSFCVHFSSIFLLNFSCMQDKIYCDGVECMGSYEYVEWKWSNLVAKIALAMKFSSRWKRRFFK